MYTTVRGSMGEKAVAGKRPVGRGQRPGERVKRPFPTPRLRGAPRVVSGCPNQVIGTGREVLSTCLIWAVQRRLRSHAARPSRAVLRCVSADAPHDHEAPLCASRGSPLCLLPETFPPPHMPLSTNAASPRMPTFYECHLSTGISPGTRAGAFDAEDQSFVPSDGNRRAVWAGHGAPVGRRRTWTATCRRCCRREG